MRQGAWYKGGGVTEFVVWAPQRNSVKVKLLGPEQRLVPLEPCGRGYWMGRIDNVMPGTRYFYMLDDELQRPDPASFFQPEGVHGPSEVVDHSGFQWQDQGWQPPALKDMVIYELHIGTFTDSGTFDGAIEKLDHLTGLGINAVELMPVAQFSGVRNWGYDGVYPYAVQNSYGGPEGLKRFVNECHKRGIAVFLDVVYNHLGPEGNYLRDYGPYFSDTYRTPWGEAVNLDGPYSDEVRLFFISNALYWFELFHIDGLRLDAIHAIFDMRPVHFLRQLKEAVEVLSRTETRAFYLVAESDLNDPKLIKSPQQGGYGLDALWNEDFHHAVHSVLTSETDGYYKDYGSLEHIVKCLNQGFAYTGQYSEFRRRSHGAPVSGIEFHRFVAFLQNHDQVGNRALGERLTKLVPFEALKAAVVLLMLSPFVPLVFMGEEFAEEAPFLYFIDHQDPALVEAVRQGRRREFEGFQWPEALPDPKAEETFLRSKLNWTNLSTHRARAMMALYRHLIFLRRQEPALQNTQWGSTSASAHEQKRVLYLTRTSKDGAHRIMGVFNLKPSEETVSLKGETLQCILSTEDSLWAGTREVLPEACSDIILLMPYEAMVFRSV